jgi:hypothetical protein
MMSLTTALAAFVTSSGTTLRAFLTVTSRQNANSRPKNVHPERSSQCTTTDSICFVMGLLALVMDAAIKRAVGV